MSERLVNFETLKPGLRFAYERIVYLPFQEPASFEALLRAEGRPGFPKEIIPLIGQRPDEFNELCFEILLKDAKSSTRKSPLPLQVNFDPVQITEGFFATAGGFAEKLVATGTWGGLIIEITERGFLTADQARNLKRAVEENQAIVGISVDDIPAGDSLITLQTLRDPDVPIREIKFADNCELKPALEEIQRLVPDLLTKADFVVEGIDSNDQMQAAIRIARDFQVQNLLGQGHLFNLETS